MENRGVVADTSGPLRWPHGELADASRDRDERDDPGGQQHEHRTLF